jgi:DNA repair protein RadC
LISLGILALVAIWTDPSAENREVTTRLAKSREILGIFLLDHVVFATERAYYSFAQSAPKLLR